jgi:hypothetical protein
MRVTWTGYPIVLSIRIKLAGKDNIKKVILRREDKKYLTFEIKD